MRNNTSSCNNVSDLLIIFTFSLRVQCHTGFILYCMSSSSHTFVAKWKLILQIAIIYINIDISMNMYTYSLLYQHLGHWIGKSADRKFITNYFDNQLMDILVTVIWLHSKNFVRSKRMICLPLSKMAKVLWANSMKTLVLCSITVSSVIEILCGDASKLSVGL